ncbi:phage holin, lambda family [Enterobacter bugandensis]|uniref:phage holin, lambda family n=1 Tax=Enterobacter TaxID=547 RepID=UPI001889937A|nr:MULTISPECIES: phage holin, lambda family [Enterobacter]MBF2748269.1 phage holin, lambda family [Enterobacter bugandensis]MBF2800191.1 phage holin, lambda family [Enterobacter bugandensis]MCP1112824.1 phage holin, lambda family [Enterobacter bugandensis]
MPGRSVSDDKNPDFWREIIDHVKAAWPQISGSFLAVLIAYARMIHDGRTGRDGEWIEGVLCGLLTLSLTSALRFLGLPDDIAPAIGGGIGFIGVRRLRKVALREFEKRTGGKHE